MSLLESFKSWGVSGGEQRLLVAAQRGDRESFDKLAHLHRRSLRGYILRRIGADGADDVLQETWLAVWSALPDLRGRSRFKAWLYGIASHKCADYLRGRVRGASVVPTQDIDDLAGAARDSYADAELRHVVETALARLPENQREVLEMYYFAELTLPEIASALQRNLNTVKYQFYRAHAQVAAILHEAAPEPASAGAEEIRAGGGQVDVRESALGASVPHGGRSLT